MVQSSHHRKINFRQAFFGKPNAYVLRPYITREQSESDASALFRLREKRENNKLNKTLTP